MRYGLVFYVGMRLTPTVSVGSSLSCQLSAAGLHAAGAANSSSKRSSTNFSTSSDNPEDVNCTSVDVGYVSAMDATQRPAPPSPTADRRRQLLDQTPNTSANDVIEAFPVGGWRHLGRSTDIDRQRRVDQLPAEVDMRTRPTSMTWSILATTNHDKKEHLSGTTTSRASRPVTWSCNANDVILSSLNQRHDVDRGIIASTP